MFARKSTPSTWILPWSSLHGMYEGMIGKTIFLVSLALPLSYLATWGVNIEKANSAIVGALLVALGFATSRVFCPGLVRNYKNRYQYSDKMNDLYKAEVLDLDTEFSGLDGPLWKFACDACHLDKSFSEHTPTAKDLREALGEPRAVFYLSQLKFEIVNRKLSFVRGLLMLLGAVGICLIYRNYLSAIFSIILG